MTRINAGINPQRLTNSHLLAEHREIKRVPNAIKSGRFSMKGAPSKFTLGTGHVKFFYDKQKYLLDRYRRIHAECLLRGHKVTDFSEAWSGLEQMAWCWNDWDETEEANNLVSARINERLKLPGSTQDWRAYELQNRQ
jgi:deoxyribonuclease (pyrimidine dimer)